VGVQEVRWDKGGPVIEKVIYILFSPLKGNENRQLGKGFFVYHRTVPAVKRVEFISDRMSYIVLIGRWCNVIVRNVHIQSERKKAIFQKTVFMRN